MNGRDQILAKRHAGASGHDDEDFHDDEDLLRTLTKVLDAPSASHRKVDPAELQDAPLDNGGRLHIMHADIRLRPPLHWEEPVCHGRETDGRGVSPRA